MQKKLHYDENKLDYTNDHVFIQNLADISKLMECQFKKYLEFKKPIKNKQICILFSNTIKNKFYSLI